MFEAGDRIYVREDLEINKEDLPEYLGAVGVVTTTREIAWSSTDNIILGILLDGDPRPKEWFARRFGHYRQEPDWEV
jgi:hypothetical protein